MDKEEYYQSLMDRYLEKGDEALTDFRGELHCLSERQKECFQRNETRARSAMTRWSEHDGEKKEVLAKFLADTEARIQQDSAEKIAFKKASKNASNAKYLPGRQNYATALEIAKTLWESGDKRTHDKMLIYIAGTESFPPGTSKELHFLKRFDRTCGYTRNGLKEKLKELAYTIDKELVFGLKKNT